MSYFDALYQEKNLYGKPYPGLLHYFKNQTQKGKILDLGCGQGRDTLALARMGYELTGVDLSEKGLQQLQKGAQCRGLNITLIQQDLFQFDNYESYDWILLDSVLHFEGNSLMLQREYDLLDRMLLTMKEGAAICICFWKEAEKEKNMLNYFQLQKNVIIEELKYLDYPEQLIQYQMLVARKTNESAVNDDIQFG